MEIFKMVKIPKFKFLKIRGRSSDFMTVIFYVGIWYYLIHFANGNLTQPFENCNTIQDEVSCL